MKYIIIGMGYFGSALAEKLSKRGSEIIGVDREMSKVEAVKDKIAHAICMDCSSKSAVSSLPLKDADVVIVAIGKDQGANIMISALMKQMQLNRVISRAVSSLHETILRAMGITEIIHPEEETAEHWANKLSFSQTTDAFMLHKDFSVVEVNVPEKYVGKTVGEIKFRETHQLVILSVIKKFKETDEIGFLRNISKINNIATVNTRMFENDSLLIFGKNDDIKKFIKEFNI